MNQNTIESAVPQAEGFTPYQLAGIASGLAGRYVREQMVYQYVAKGFIPSVRGVKQTKAGTKAVKVVLRADAVAWLAKYLKVEAAPTNTEEADLLADLAELA